MKTRFGARRGPHRAFTLVELLVVLFIIVIVAAITIPSIVGTSGAQRFSNGLDQIAGILEQARTYAVAQDTYVWVAFYPYDPSLLTTPDNSGDALGVVAFASMDGTDPINWNSVSVSMSSTGTVSGTTIKQILPFAAIKQTVIRTQSYYVYGTGPGQISSMPSNTGTTTLTGAAAIPTFVISIPARGLTTLPAALPGDAQTTQQSSIVQFTPSGQARVSGSPVDSVWIDFQRAKGKGVIDDNNIAAFRINGLTGVTTIYRK